MDFISLLSRLMRPIVWFALKTKSSTDDAPLNLMHPKVIVDRTLADFFLKWDDESLGESGSVSRLTDRRDTKETHHVAPPHMWVSRWQEAGRLGDKSLIGCWVWIPWLSLGLISAWSRRTLRETSSKNRELGLKRVFSVPATRRSQDTKMHSCRPRRGVRVSSKSNQIRSLWCMEVFKSHHSERISWFEDVGSLQKPHTEALSTRDRKGNVWMRAAMLLRADDFTSACQHHHGSHICLLTCKDLNFPSPNKFW